MLFSHGPFLCHICVFCFPCSCLAAMTDYDRLCLSVSVAELWIFTDARFVILTDSRLIISTGGPCFASVSPVLSLLVFISSTLFFSLG